MTQKLLVAIDEQEFVFKDVLAYIDEHFAYQPSSFQNGTQRNSANENQGSARVLYLGKMSGLSVDDTLKLFAEHYRSVLAAPEGDDHQNIRQFMQQGWEGVRFDREVLRLK